MVGLCIINQILINIIIKDDLITVYLILQVILQM